MGIRFYKSFSLLPFVRANISKSGVSFSIGRRGAVINLGKDGVRASAGIPGSGLSYRKKLASTNSPLIPKIIKCLLLAAVIIVLVYVFIK